jgi:hypothetical protein
MASLFFVFEHVLEDKNITWKQFLCKDVVFQLSIGYIVFSTIITTAKTFVPNKLGRLEIKPP